MRRFLACLLSVLMAAGLIGCSAGVHHEKGAKYCLYYLNQELNQIQEQPYEPAGQSREAMILEFTAAMKNSPEEELIPVLPEGVAIEDYSLDEETLTLNMSESYGQMDRSREILVRAALVQTFLQIEGISWLKLETGGEPLKDSAGEEVGRLNEDSFVVNSGKEINTYDNAQLTLYFADESGKHLLEEQRSIYYSTNLPLERVVVEQLVRGPSEESHYAVLPSELNILSVTTSEGICYVNFDEGFTASALPADPELRIYSIVESLSASCHVNRVQFSINGKSDVMLGDSMDLSQLYEADESLIAEE